MNTSNVQSRLSMCVLPVNPSYFKQPIGCYIMLHVFSGLRPFRKHSSRLLVTYPLADKLMNEILLI